MAIDQAWWDSLDSEWKEIFAKNLELETITPEAFPQIAAATRLNLSQSKITSFAPITGLEHLTHVDFSGCRALTSFDGLPVSVQVVTFHWLKMDDISWVDKLPNLAHAYGDKDLQRKVKLRISKNRKARGA
jgi:hypothetical protein